MKSVYSVRATFEIEVDPAKPETMTAAAAWIAKLQSGDVVAKPEGAVFRVEVQAPKITNKRE